eukprot:GHVP01067442.1.p1 GENE.GHVP01067442.1~~GHVP01067442.1.p1  ORF type:complete len:248 (+),score=42.32 GHVP01067442.1:32-775(+)
MNSKSEVKAGLAGAALMTVNGLLSNFSISDFEPGNEPQHENPEGIKTGSSPTGEDIRVQGKETADAGPPPVSSPTQVVQIRLNQTDPLLEDTQSEESQTGASVKNTIINDLFDLLSRRQKDLKSTSNAKHPELGIVIDFEKEKLPLVLGRYTAVGRRPTEKPGAIFGYTLKKDVQKAYPSAIAKIQIGHQYFVYFKSFSGEELFVLAFDLGGSLLDSEITSGVMNDDRILPVLERLEQKYLNQNPAV